MTARGIAAQRNRLIAENETLRSLVEGLASIRPVPEFSVPGKSICAACWQIFTDDGHGWFTEDSQHTLDCPVARARAFLRA